MIQLCTDTEPKFKSQQSKNHEDGLNRLVVAKNPYANRQPFIMCGGRCYSLRRIPWLTEKPSWYGGGDGSGDLLDPVMKSCKRRLEGYHKENNERDFRLFFRLTVMN